jgi:DNA-binding GntR family transcriptional regulator
MDELERYLSAHEAPPEDGSSSRLLREVAYERLKDAIQHADLQPGEPLPESRLSRLLGISRTPVREALQQLAQEGLVQIIPGRVVTVAAHSVQEVLNVVHLRSLLEPELVRLATESISEDGLEDLWQSLLDMETAVENDDREGWSKADTWYHETLGQACPNDLLSEMTLQMRNRVHHLAVVDSQTNPARLAACTREHREIVEAIAAHDPQGAEEAMRRHIDELRKSLFNRLSFG